MHHALAQQGVSEEDVEKQLDQALLLFRYISVSGPWLALCACLKPDGTAMLDITAHTQAYTQCGHCLALMLLHACMNTET